MALATTTNSSAIGVNDNSIVVASATSMAAGRFILINQEVMKVGQAYVAASTTVPVLRGQDGTVTAAHKVTTNVTHGLASDFALASAQTATTYPLQRARILTAITATTSTVTLPAAGSDLVLVLNGAAAITLTIPVPTKDMDGTELTIMSNGAAQHVLTFTGGLSGAGGSYDIITVNATAPAAFKFIACNALWLAVCGPAVSGTTTNIAGVIS